MLMEIMFRFHILELFYRLMSFTQLPRMLKLQKLMIDEFGVTAKNNNKLAGIANISEVLGAGDSAEND